MPESWGQTVVLFGHREIGNQEINHNGQRCVTSRCRYDRAHGRQRPSIGENPSHGGRTALQNFAVIP